ncbi:hypothetical protein PENTCL1PPCAC_8161, partial [Pristionchus entomophagus]
VIPLVIAAGVTATGGVVNAIVRLCETKSNNALERERINAVVETVRLDKERAMAESGLRLDGAVAQALHESEIEHAEKREAIDERHRKENEQIRLLHEAEKQKLKDAMERKERESAEKDAKIHRVYEASLNDQREQNRRMFEMCAQMGAVALESQRVMTAISMQLVKMNCPRQPAEP